MVVFMNKMKKNILLLTFAFAVIIIGISICVALLRKSTYSNDLSFTYMGYGFSSQGITFEPNSGVSNLEYMHFIDMKSGYDIPLCTIPNCKHDSDSCFAYVLADPMNCYSNMLIYDTKLYYTQTISSFQENDIKYNIEIYESTLQGDKTNKIASFDNYSFVEAIYIQDGYLYTILRRKEMNSQGDGISSQSPETNSVGIVNLSNKECFQTPEKSGFNNVMLFLGCSKDSIYYEYLSSESEESMDQFSIFEYNCKTKSEKIWNDYNEIGGNSFIYFRVLKNNMITLEPNDAFDKFMVSEVDLYNLRKKQLGSFEFSAYISFNPYIIGDNVFLSEYGEDGMTVLGNYYYDLNTQKQKEITGFTEFGIINRINDTLLLFDEKNSRYATISVEDYLKSNTNGLTIIKKSMYE